MERVRFMQFFYYKIVNYTTPCGAVQCIVTCSAIRLCHFAGNFSAIFTVCAAW